MEVNPESAVELAVGERPQQLGREARPPQEPYPDAIAVTVVTDGQLPSAYFGRVRSYLQ